MWGNFFSLGKVSPYPFKNPPEEECGALPLHPTRFLKKASQKLLFAFGGKIEFLRQKRMLLPYRVEGVTPSQGV